MSCAYPMIQYNKTLKKYITIPCGRCLGCLIDKREMWEERANYEYKTKLVGAFITLTYSNESLIDCLIIDNQGQQQFTLKKEHLRKYIRNIREAIKDQEETALTQHKFSYIACGEYGESNKELPRPHLHIIIFGLDWYANKKTLEDAWEYGITDIRPILRGGIRYVLKYMDKQLNTDEIFEKYGRKCLQEPFKTQSKSFGENLYKEKLMSGEANANNWYTYKGYHNKPMKIPEHYIDKYLGINHDKRESDIERQIELYNATHQQKDKIEKGNLIYFPKARGKHERERLREYNRQRAETREKNLEIQMRNEGKPVNSEWKEKYIPP